MSESLGRAAATGTARSAGRLIVVHGAGVARASDGPMPGTYTDTAQDENLTRLYAIWTADTPHLDNIAVGWRFDEYSGVFRPTEDDRLIGTPAARFVYAYDPNPSGPFRRGNFRDKGWEAWTITAPSPDVRLAEISVLTEDPSRIVMLGAAITRNGAVVCTDGPRPDAAHCTFDFTQ